MFGTCCEAGMSTCMARGDGGRHEDLCLESNSPLLALSFFVSGDFFPLQWGEQFGKQCGRCDPLAAVFHCWQHPRDPTMDKRASATPFASPPRNPVESRLPLVFGD